MKNIIESMFYGDINEAERKLNVKLSKEWEKAFKVFEKSLSEEQKELFNKYYIEDGAHIGNIERERYEQGFKTGFWLAMQLADFSL